MYRSPSRPPLNRLIPLVPLLLVLPIIACRNSDSSRDAPQKPRVALIMKSLANPFFKTMEEGAKRHQAEHADEYELIVNGLKDERDLSRQVALVEEMVAARVDAIVIAPADSKALAPVLRRAQKAGIVVINIDNKLDDAVLKKLEVKIPFVGPDNRKGAKMVGDVLAAALPDGVPVGLLEGIPTAFNSQQRRAGFEEAMKESGHEIIAVQSGQWETAIANQVAAAMLSEHPQIGALLCCNDDMALGALSAVKAAGRLKQVKIVGFDNTSAVQQVIARQEILATADQHADRLAVFGIELALETLKSGGVSAGGAISDRETPVDLVTRETLVAGKSPSSEPSAD